MEITVSSLTIGYAFTHASHARARDRDLFLRNRTKERRREKRKHERPIEWGRRGRKSERGIEIDDIPGAEKDTWGKTNAHIRTYIHTYTSYVLRAIIQAAITRSCRVHPFSGEFFLLPFPQLRPLSPSGPSSISPVPYPPSSPVPTSSREISLFSSPTAMP